ncbi:hypothetical protein BV22DRAFT_1041681 [Leucogyrophana mollusca]|uniref:Uncharacterized protein n=1 Tax=Leucogyrophana mollusca TaxID=85980 RepID=A0ACB8AYT1_9AGAM|nr:hypothetical protein BV22DRAFT_1041681 [Leucogyrophana mollusca]
MPCLRWTAAGNALRSSLKDLAATHKKTVMELRGDNGGDDDVQKRLKDTENQICALLGQIPALDIPIDKRILAYFGSR